MTLNATAPTWLAGYCERGFKLVFWRRSDNPEEWKGPREEDWPTRDYPPELWHEGMNVGAKLGTEIEPGKFLADVDFDWCDGVSLFAKLLLPVTGFGFGRLGKPTSHAFFTTSTPVVSREFKDIDNAMLVELRGTKHDGTVGKQTMLPPSIHPSGEQLTLAVDDGIGHVGDLPGAVCHYAIACILLKHFRILGDRPYKHNPRMAAAGFLLKDCRLSREDASAISVAVATATGNDAADAAATVRDTADRLRTRARVSGRKALAEALGEHGKEVVDRIRSWMAPTLGATDVVMRGGDLTSIVDKSEAALRASTISIYQRGGLLVRPVRTDRASDDAAAVRRANGSTVISVIHESWLLEQMGQVLHWHKERANGECSVADPAPLYARTLLARAEWQFPVLRGVVRAPTLDRDGRIIEGPGFDTESGLLLDFEPGMFPPVPVDPTKGEARVALEQLADPLRGFPFGDDASRSVALAAVLTALVRSSLRTAPMHAFDAPTAGTGKSLLAEAVGLLAMGVLPPALSQGKSAEEDEKRLSTVLMAGDPVIHIDNCERPIAGDFLCSLLTQQIVQARILGLSERRVLPSTALVLASGNNLTWAGDASRRAVICRLDAGMERPDTREFDFDCHTEILAARPALVVAGLTVLCAYALADRPVKLTPMGSFADYDWIRGALVWLGCADPADTRQTILDNDPRKDELVTVMDLWAEALGDRRVEVGEITQLQDQLRLVTALQDAACRGREWSSKSVGWWLRRHKDRVVDGRCFRNAATSEHRQQWWLEAQNDDYKQAPFPDNDARVQ